MERDSFYPIRAVAKLVGMTTDSIRAWERRYDAIKPARSKGGRLYSDCDVQRLMLLKQAVDHGHSIGQIARLEDTELKQLPLESESSRHRKRLEEREVNRIMAYMAEYDAVSADRLLGSMAALQPPREFIYTLVLPLMRRVGESWHEGRISIAQEHMLSSILRSLLGTLLRINSRETAEHTLLFTTLPGERHEFGILSAAMLTAGAGLSAIYLGPDLPLEDTLAAQSKTGAHGLVLSMIPDDSRDERHLDYLRALHKKVDPGVNVILGGQMTEAVNVAANAFGFRVFGEMHDYETYILENGGRF